MVGTYDVFQGERAVGTIRVERLGLYYHFSCRCRPEGKQLLRLWMRRGRQETDLGLCVPVEGAFGTEKRIPVKQCGEGGPAFFLCAPHVRHQFIPLAPEEPFRYIHRLENAYLEQRGNTLGIVIPIHEKVIANGVIDRDGVVV